MKKILKSSTTHLTRRYHQVKRQVKDHFIPHDGNNHHPHVLSHKALVGYSIVLVLIKVFAIIASVALPAASLYSSSITPTNVVELTNATRKNLGLDPLAVSSKLEQAAAAKANDMMQNQYFSHNSPAGVTPWVWFKNVGYNYTYAGENLAVHYTSAEALEEGWLASPSHRANIVNPHYSEIGIGVAQGVFEGFNSTIVVQLFGRPTAAEVKKEPVAVKPAVTNQPVIAPAGSGQVAAAQISQLVIPITEPPTVINQLPAAPLAANPVIYDGTLLLKRDGNVYNIRLAVSNASKVTAQLADAWVDLTADSSGEVWQGKISYDPKIINAHGEALSVIALGRNNTKANKVIALIAPSISTQQFYNFSDNSQAVTLWGWLKITNLNDSVHRFYVYFMIFLAGALLLNILIKIRIQHATVIGHAMSVMALAGLMLLI